MPQARANADWGDVALGRLRPATKQPMKYQIVERYPGRAAVPPDDSDDESDCTVPVPESDEEEHRRLYSPLAPDTSASEDDDDDEPPEDPVLEDEYDFDTAQHHREIALEYYEKRDTIGKNAARAMSAHAHERLGNDDWDQPVSASSHVFALGS